MTKDEIKTRARAALAKALKTDPNAIGDDASQAQLSDWDSVRHMNVVLALENDFEIEFEASELPGLTSLPLLIAAIEKHTAGL
jgi:acyl carrier protein